MFHNKPNFVSSLNKTFHGILILRSWFKHWLKFYLLGKHLFFSILKLIFFLKTMSILLASNCPAPSLCILPLGGGSSTQVANLYSRTWETLTSPLSDLSSNLNKNGGPGKAGTVSSLCSQALWNTSSPEHSRTV